MTRAIIGFPSRRDDFTLFSGNWDAAYPVENAQDTEFARVARTTGVVDGDAVIKGSASNLLPLRIFGVAAHNMTLDATYRLRLYEDTASPSVEVYDTGVQLVWPAVYTYEGRDWDTENFWTGQYASAEIAGQIPFLPILLDQKYLASSFTLEFFDSSNPAGVIDIGFVDPASGWELSVEPAAGGDSQYGLKSFTRTTTLDGGLKRHEVFAPSYVFQGSIPIMDRAEVQNNAAELYRQHGVHEPFIWIPHPDEPEYALRNSKLVNLAELGLFSYIVGGQADSFPLNLEEFKG